jgi:hypothetical protein
MQRRGPIQRVNKTKIQAVYMNVLKSIEGRTRRDRIRSEIFREV